MNVSIKTSVFLVALACVMPAHAQSSIRGKTLVIPKMTAPRQTLKSDPSLIHVEETSRFFFKFDRVSEMPERGEFETRAEYAKRLPVPVNNSKVAWFRLETTPSALTATTLGVEPDEEGKKQYSYNIDSETLTLFAGGEPPEVKELTKKPSGIPVCIKHQVIKDEHYIAANAFKATKNVNVWWVQYFALDILNFAEIDPFLLDHSESKFQVTLKCPRKEARKLSGQLEILVGCTLVSYDAHAAECVYSHKPTFSEPRDNSEFISYIGVNVKSIVIRNKVTGEIIARKNIIGLPSISSATAESRDTKDHANP